MRALAGLAAGCLALGASCAGSDEQALPGRASSEPSAPASPAPDAEPSPEKEIAKVLARFTRAVKDEDARTTANLVDRKTIRYLKRLQDDVGSAGPGRIARLSPWEKLALTGLRTDFDEETLGALSVEGFLDHLLDYEEIFLPYEKLDPKRIRVDGSRATVKLDLPRGRLRFQRAGGSWRLDARRLFHEVDENLVRLARQRGWTVDELVLRLGERITLYRLTPDVWEDPE